MIDEKVYSNYMIDVTPQGIQVFKLFRGDSYPTCLRKAKGWQRLKSKALKTSEDLYFQKGTLDEKENVLVCPLQDDKNG